MSKEGLNPPEPEEGQEKIELCACGKPATDINIWENRGGWDDGQMFGIPVCREHKIEGLVNELEDKKTD